MNHVIRYTTSAFVCVFIVFGFLGDFPLSAASAQETESESFEVDEEQELRLDYRVRIEGIKRDELRDTLRAVSDTVSLRERPPPTAALLKRRALSDIPKLSDALRSRGYYDHKIDVTVDDSESPAQVTFEITPGPQYTLGPVVVEYTDQSIPNQPAPPSRDQLGLREGTPALARPVINAEGTILARLRRSGFPFPKIQRRRATVDHETDTLSVVYRVDTGPYARFGETEISGLEKVKEEVVRSRLPWSPGTPYSPELVDEARKRYVAMGVFAMVQVNPARELNKEGQLPVTVSLIERLHRTYAFGAGFTTDQGPGATVSWEHRNITGRADKFVAELGGYARDFGIRVNYDLPYFRRPDQKLTLSAFAGQKDVEAFTSREMTFETIVRRNITEHFSAGGGIRLRYAQADSEIEAEDDDTYSQVSFPFFLQWDTRDEAADPSGGWLNRLEIEPYFGVGDSDPYFLRIQGDVRRYFRVTEKTTIATRLTLGTLVGAGRKGIPIDERFFSGGGSAVRGFEYKSLSILDDNDDPIGGRSLFEVSIEARRRINDTFGFVAFVDGGNAYEDVLPTFDEPIRWGAGVGARIFTPAGPLRIDVAVPINKRDEIDDSFQLYASFGHAF